MHCSHPQHLFPNGSHQRRLHHYWMRIVGLLWYVILQLDIPTYTHFSFPVGTLHAFMKRRRQFSELLASNSNLTFNRYFRLMALSTTSLMLLIPISSYGIYLNVTSQPLGPWRGWSDTHFDFGRVQHIPAIIWRANERTVIANELNRWLSPVCAFIFFINFGVASEARRHYRTAFWFVAGRLGFKPQARSEKAGMQTVGYVGLLHRPPSFY